MIEVLTSEEMASVDARAIDEYGLPSIVLMENAALAVADVIVENYAEARRILIVCGAGNNGGDGFAVARHLHQRGLDVLLLVAARTSDLSGDARINFDICGKLGLETEEVSSESDLQRGVFERCDLIVDAIFGTGLNRPVEGFRSALIEAINDTGLPVVAIDLPSGLRGSTGSVAGPIIDAEMTVTFCRPKVAHVLDPAASHCGTVVVADISIPDEAVDAEECRLSLVTASGVVAWFAPRPPDSHKGTWGDVGIVAGSAGRTGAAILASRAAVRAGAGLVTVISDPDSAAIIDVVSVESMSKTFAMGPAEAERIAGILGDRDAVLVGPGLRDDEAGYELVRGLLDRVSVPLVLDASGLNAFAGRPEALQGGGLRVLTPHPGELGRLLGRTAKEINGDRLEAAREAAGRCGSIVVLKGHQTVIADPDGRVAVNPTGNAGMASGGMGDVLAGMIVALLARSDDPFGAACAAVYLHGLAGDLLRDEGSDVGLRAIDLAETLPRAVAVLRERAG